MKKLIACLFMILPYCAMAQTFEESYSDITDIQLSIGSANCIIKAATNDQVTVRLDHEMGDDYSPKIEKRGDKLIIKDNPDHRNIHGKMVYTLSLPDDLSLSYNTGSGNVEAKGLTLELKGNSGSGNLKFTNMKGSVAINTGSGNINVSDYEGEVKMNAGSGNSDITGLRGDLSLNCGSGNLMIRDSEATIKANAGSGNINAENITLAGESGFNVGSGKILLNVAAAPAFDLSLNSGSGTARLDLDGNSFDGTVVMTSNKRNGTIKAPFTFTKQEEFKEGNETKIRKTAELGSSDVMIKIGTGSGSAEVINE